MIRSNNFNPWTVIERYPAGNCRDNKKIAFYMMYAGGANYALIGAKLRIHIANYAAGDDNLDDFWIQKYDEPFILSEEQGQGYHKKQLTNIEVKPEECVREYMAVKATLYSADPDSMGSDFYWEGISILPYAEGGEWVRKEQPK